MRIMVLLFGFWLAGIASAQNYPVELYISSASFGDHSSATYPSSVWVAAKGIPATAAWVETRLQLPPGVKFVDQVPYVTTGGPLPNLPTTCSVTPASGGGESVVCRTTGNNASNAQHHALMRFAIPDPSALPAGGQFSIVYSLHLPDRDPDFNQCATTGGRVFVGCANLTHVSTPQRWTPRNFRHAEQPQSGSATWGTPMRVGKRAVLGLEWNYSGGIVPGAPATAYLLLPPGVTYTPLPTNPLGAGVTCQKDAPIGNRELLVCAISAVNMTGYVLIQPLHLTLGREVPSGTITFHGVIDAPHQPMPSNWFADPGQACTACYTIPVPVLGPRMTLSTAMPIPSEPWVVNRPAELDVWMRNNELTGASGTFHLHVQLPPGMHYRNHDANGWPASTCAAQPSGLGDVLTCTWTTPMGAQDNRRIVLRVDTDTSLASPGPVPILFALEENPLPSAGTELTRCAANPNVPDCLLLGRPTQFVCASRYTDGIYCDHFEGPLPQ